MMQKTEFKEDFSIGKNNFQYSQNIGIGTPAQESQDAISDQDSYCSQCNAMRVSCTLNDCIDSDVMQNQTQHKIRTLNHTITEKPKQLIAARSELHHHHLDVALGFFSCDFWNAK